MPNLDRFKGYSESTWNGSTLYRFTDASGKPHPEAAFIGYFADEHFMNVHVDEWIDYSTKEIEAAIRLTLEIARQLASESEMQIAVKFFDNGRYNDLLIGAGFVRQSGLYAVNWIPAGKRS
ncbi:hypothetical protein KBD71_01180 [Candidatus Woesebacteria bacterium]|nr:hypothetical protein [Candidatus Woesebacteria bacterium]